MQVVKHKVGKITFEIGTKKGSVLLFKQGSVTFDQVLDSDVIWKDLKKGDRASKEELIAAYGTDDTKKVAEQIVLKGELQLTDQERKDIVSKKRAEIINYIHKYYVDPKTKVNQKIRLLILTLAASSPCGPYW